jgi:hypothetical protein
MTKEFTRDYRPIEVADLDAASRALRMTHVSDARLMELVENHKGLDDFASGVIEEAARREMGYRCCANYLAITHDDHRGMGTGQATWRSMWGVAVLRDGEWWLHLQANSEQAAYERYCELVVGSKHFGLHNTALVKPDGYDGEDYDDR